jgi:hypothetical protein
LRFSDKILYALLIFPCVLYVPPSRIILICIFKETGCEGVSWTQLAHGRLPVLCCPVQVEVPRWTDPQSKDFYPVLN